MYPFIYLILDPLPNRFSAYFQFFCYNIPPVLDYGNLFIVLFFFLKERSMTAIFLILTCRKIFVPSHLDFWLSTKFLGHTFLPCKRCRTLTAPCSFMPTTPMFMHLILLWRILRSPCFSLPFFASWTFFKRVISLFSCLTGLTELTVWYQILLGRPFQVIFYFLKVFSVLLFCLSFLWNPIMYISNLLF